MHLIEINIFRANQFKIHFNQTLNYTNSQKISTEKKDLRLNLPESISHLMESTM